MGGIQTDDQGLAIGGIDPVSCFKGAPAMGRETHSVTWQDAIWRFDKAEHSDLFTSDPQRYSPQYGGHCALAVRFGKAAHADPKVCLVHNDKLYFFASPMVRRFWRLFGSPQKAERNWVEIQSEGKI